MEKWWKVVDLGGIAPPTDTPTREDEYGNIYVYIYTYIYTYICAYILYILCIYVHIYIYVRIYLVCIYIYLHRYIIFWGCKHLGNNYSHRTPGRFPCKMMQHQNMAMLPEEDPSSASERFHLWLQKIPPQSSKVHRPVRSNFFFWGGGVGKCLPRPLSKFGKKSSVCCFFCCKAFFLIPIHLHWKNWLGNFWGWNPSTWSDEPPNLEWWTPQLGVMNPPTWSLILRILPPSTLEDTEDWNDGTDQLGWLLRGSGYLVTGYM